MFKHNQIENVNKTIEIDQMSRIINQLKFLVNEHEIVFIYHKKDKI